MHIHFVLGPLVTKRFILGPFIYRSWKFVRKFEIPPVVQGPNGNSTGVLGSATIYLAGNAFWSVSETSLLGRTRVKYLAIADVYEIIIRRRIFSSRLM